MAESKNLQPVQVIAKIFGMSTRQVANLKTEGIIEGEGKPTKYDLLPTIQKYIRYLSDKAYAREKKESIEALEKEKLEADVKIKKSKAKAAELELKELEGKMHRAEDVEEIFTDFVLRFRGLLLAMPGKLAVDLAGEHTAAEQSQTVKVEVYYILNQLANYRYDPEEYKKRVMMRQGWDISQESENDGG